MKIIFNIGKWLVVFKDEHDIAYIVLFKTLEIGLMRGRTFFKSLNVFQIDSPHIQFTIIDHGLEPIPFGWVNLKIGNFHIKIKPILNFSIGVECYQDSNVKFHYFGLTILFFTFQYVKHENN
jgi:hypothetical protein